MKCLFTAFPILLFSALTLAQEPDYTKPVSSYLQRIQQGDQTHAFSNKIDFPTWQKNAREALVELIGLKRMGSELADHVPIISASEAVNIDGKYSRSLHTIETEPGVVIPFYLLIPNTVSKDKPAALFFCPHGHDALGLHSYAGAFKDEKHRKTVLAKEGNIGEQAVLRGMIALVPATRGLADELPSRNGFGICCEFSIGPQNTPLLIAPASS